MARVDVVVAFAFDVEHPERTVLKTNMKREGLEEVLEAWLFNQIGQAADEREAVQRSVYTIGIGVDLSDDTIFTNSDTGNEGLTCGIVMDVFARLANLEMQPL